MNMFPYNGRHVEQMEKWEYDPTLPLHLSRIVTDNEYVSVYRGTSPIRNSAPLGPLWKP